MSITTRSSHRISSPPQRTQLFAAILLSAAFLTPSAAAEPAIAPATEPSAEPSIRIMGPLAAKDMIEELANGFFKARGRVKIDYDRMDLKSGIGPGLVAARDMALVFGTMDERSLGAAKAQWLALKPAEHVLGARSLAIVVHPRNPIESLTLDQVQSIYSGKITAWKILGGEDKPIRRHGLEIADPLTKLFQEKISLKGAPAPYTRQKDSTALAIALSSDPQGVGFMDAITAATQAQSLRIVPISDGKTAVWPNAQTLRDGTYKLGDPLMLYVSPKAAGYAKEFSDYLVSGRADATYRKYGFLPALQAMTNQAMALFERLYGADIKQVTTTPQADDDIALSALILSSARTTKLDETMAAVMCNAAYELANRSFAGQTAALDAVQTLWQTVPSKRFDAASKWVSLYQRAYDADKTPANAEHLIITLMAAADIGTKTGEYIACEKFWQRAITLAQTINATESATLLQRLPAFEARVRSVADRDALKAKLQATPTPALQKQLLLLELIDLNNPEAASAYLDNGSDEALKANIPLTIMNAQLVAEDTALRLAEWYIGLAQDAGPGGRELMLQEARTYYLRFFNLHTNRSDSLAVRAELGLKKAGGTPPPATAPASIKNVAITPVPQRDNSFLLRPTRGKEPPMTDLRLAELIVANPDAVILSHIELGSTQFLTDLRPLTRLQKLKTLELQGITGVKDISPVASLTSVNKLSLHNLTAETLASLASLKKLDVLEITASKNVADISPLSGLSQLRQLSLSGCPKISSLEPLVKLTSLTNLNLAQCAEVTDLTALSKLTQLKVLSLNGCTKVENLRALASLVKLRTLDLRQCEKIPDTDMDWLAAQMPACKIIRVTPPKK